MLATGNLEDERTIATKAIVFLSSFLIPDSYTILALVNDCVAGILMPFNIKNA